MSVFDFKTNNPTSDKGESALSFKDHDCSDSVEVLRRTVDPFSVNREKTYNRRESDAVRRTMSFSCLLLLDKQKK